MISKTFNTIDLFAGPGGLAEGFSRVEIDGVRPFRPVLSVEKDPAAFATLRLRAFVRQFERLPPNYHKLLNGELTVENLAEAHKREWKAACEETLMAELGSSDAVEQLAPRLSRIAASPRETIVIGGPPCQAYSLVGRSRNKGIAGYSAKNDGRHFLYEEYIQILSRVRPAAFVMENVKGILSSRIGKNEIFPQILKDLQQAGGTKNSYELIPLGCAGATKYNEHIVRAEHFGIPQNRHRVILVGLRRDIAEKSHRLLGLNLASQNGTFTKVADALDGMPRLRSGLSRSTDSDERWRLVAAAAFRTASRATREQSKQLSGVALRLAKLAEMIERQPNLSRSSIASAPMTNKALLNWIQPYGKVPLANHEARSHMEEDLARYAFVSTFTMEYGRSPRTSEFPAGLASDHRNWNTSNFTDRFRCQSRNLPSSTVTSHIAKDGHYFIHPDPLQCRSLTVREAARLQTFPDDYIFLGNRTQQYAQVGNAVPPLLALKIGEHLYRLISASFDDHESRRRSSADRRVAAS